MRSPAVLEVSDAVGMVVEAPVDREELPTTWVKSFLTDSLAGRSSPSGPVIGAYATSEILVRQL
jgi:hypothetical protein